MAAPDPDKIPPNDLNYLSPDSELILEHLQVVAHEGQSAGLREIMMTIDAEKFVEEGHTPLKLEDGIFQTYMDIYKNRNKAMIMMAANKKTVEKLFHDTIFHDRVNGRSMLLVLIFYMGIDDGGKTYVTREQAQKVVRFQPTRERWQA